MVTPVQSDKHRAAKLFIQRCCSKLTVDKVDWKNASDPGDAYNCVGFAVGVLKWWQPPVRADDGTILNPTDYWPAKVPELFTIEAYIQAIKTVGFTICDSPSWDLSYQKIVLYYDVGKGAVPSFFKHAAIQTHPDVWESKLGLGSDIKHSIDSLDNTSDPDSGASCYGDGRVFMRRLKGNSHIKTVRGK